jgi:N-acetylneuraminate synthase
MSIRNPILIAEIGCNHKGDMSIARQFIDTAQNFCGVKYVKFQKRNPRELLDEAQYNSPHPVPENAYGPTYGAHREALEFSVEQHRELKAYCDEKGLVYSSSVWDVTSLLEIISLNPTFIKIPSATNTHTDLLETACREFRGEIHISLGMTTRAEELALVELLQDHGRAKDCVLYHCTSGYPIAPEEACLLEIPRLVEAYGSIVKDIGYSGHHNGIALDIAAFALGANYIERHYTLDRTWKGTDHAASLEPDGLRRLNRNLFYTAQALQTKPAEILSIEQPQRAKLKWRKT